MKRLFALFLRLAFEFLGRFDNFINQNSAVFSVAGYAFHAVIAALSWIQLTLIAFAAVDALDHIKRTFS